MYFDRALFKQTLASKAGGVRVIIYALSLVGFLRVNSEWWGTFLVPQIHKYSVVAAVLLFALWVSASIFTRKYVTKRTTDERANSFLDAISIELRHASILLVLVPAIIAVVTGFFVSYNFLTSAIKALLSASAGGASSGGFGEFLYLIANAIYLGIWLISTFVAALMYEIHTSIEKDTALGTWLKKASGNLRKLAVFSGLTAVAQILFWFSVGLIWWVISLGARVLS